MPTYDLFLIIRTLPRAELVDSLKRSCTNLMEAGGIIRKMESFGERKIPQRTFQHNKWHTHGTYFFVTCDLPFNKLAVLTEEFGRDRDILRKAFLAVKPKESPVCTLEDELKTPSYRPSVQALIKEGRKPPRFKKIFDPKTGLDYQPLQR